MLLAVQADVETRLGRDLTESEEARLDGLLEESSALVEGYLGIVYEDGDAIPSAVVIVVSKIVARAIGGSAELDALAASMEQTNAGPWGARFRDSNVYLTKADKLMLRPIGGGGYSVVTLRSERVDGS